MEIRETAGRVFIDNKRPAHQEIPPLSPGIHLFGVKDARFISWGLQQIDIDEETPRSTRLNVDSHF